MQSGAWERCEMQGLDAGALRVLHCESEAPAPNE